MRSQPTPIKRSGNAVVGLRSGRLTAKTLGHIERDISPISRPA